MSFLNMHTEEKYDRRREAMLAAKAAGVEFDEQTFWEEDHARRCALPPFPHVKEVPVDDPITLANQALLKVIDELTCKHQVEFDQGAFEAQAERILQGYCENTLDSIPATIEAECRRVFGENIVAVTTPFTVAYAEWLTARYAIIHPNMVLGSIGPLLPALPQQPFGAGYPNTQEIPISTLPGLVDRISPPSLRVDEAKQTEDAQAFVKDALTQRFVDMVKEAKAMGLEGHFEMLIRPAADRLRDERFARVIQDHLGYAAVANHDCQGLATYLIRQLDAWCNGEID